MNIDEFSEKINRLKYFDAKVAMRGENIERAAGLFENHYSKKANRNDNELARLYGNVLLRLERLEEAFQVFDSAFSANPSNAFFAFKAGFVQERLGNLEVALKRYNDAIRLDQGSAEYRYRRARVNSRLGFREQAVSDAESAIAIDDSDSRYHELLRSASYVLPLWRQLQILENGIKHHSSSSTWLRSLAMTAFRMKRWEQALATFVKLDSVGALSEKDAVYAYVSASRIPDSSYEYFSDRALRLTKDNRSKIEGVARLLAKHGFLDESLEKYAERANIAPRAQIFYARGMIFSSQHRWAEAERDFHKAVGISPFSKEYNFRLAYVLERQFKYADAAVSYRASIASSNLDDYRRYRAVYCYEKAGQKSQCVDLIIAQLASNSEDAACNSQVTDSWHKYQNYSSSTVNDHLSAHIDRVLSEPHLVSQTPNIRSVAIACGRLGRRRDFVELVDLTFSRSMKHPSDFMLECAQIACHIGEENSGVQFYLASRVFKRPIGFDRKTVLKTRQSMEIAKYIEFQETQNVDSNTVILEMNHGRTLSANLVPVLKVMLGREEFIHSKFYIVFDGDTLPEELRSDSRIIQVHRGSDLYLRILATAKYLVNDNTFPPYFSRRREQKYLNTWHGTPMKSLGKKIRNGEMDHRNAARNLLHVTHLCLPNRHTARVLLEDNDVAHIFSGGVQVAGSPSGDDILRIARDPRLLRSIVGSLKGFDRGKKTVLYAPTWRGDLGAHFVDTEGISATLDVLSASSKFNVIFKGHPMNAEELAAADLKSVIMPPAGLSTNELLAISDLLVTDYSSVAFDFAVLERPVVLHVYDREEYEQQRGFSVLPERLSAHISSSAEELFSLLDDFSSPTGLDADFAREAGLDFRSNSLGESAEHVVDFLCSDSAGDKYVYDTGHSRMSRELVFFQGSFMPNGITSSFQALSKSLVDQDIGVTVIVEPGAMFSDPQRVERFQALDPRVRSLGRVGGQSVTAEERRVIDRFNHVDRFESADLEEVYWHAFEREARRLFGGAYFDVSICFEGYARFWMALMARVRSGKTGAYLHNDMVGEANTRFPYLAGVAQQYRQFDVLASVSHSVGEANRAALPVLYDTGSSEFVSIRNLIDLDAIRSAASARSPEPVLEWMAEQNYVFVNSARLSPEKDQEKLIEALGRLIGAGFDASLVIVGQGPLRESLGMLVSRAGLDNRVLFTDYVANPFPIVKHADSFVLSSEYEGQGLVVLEALALGRDVVSTDVVGPRSILRDGAGNLVENSAGGLFEGMREMIEGWKPSREFSFDEYVEAAVSEFKGAFDV